MTEKEFEEALTVALPEEFDGATIEFFGEGWRYDTATIKRAPLSGPVCLEAYSPDKGMRLLTVMAKIAVGHREGQFKDGLNWKVILLE